MIAAFAAAWRADVDSEPMPQLVDVDTALAIIRQGLPVAAGCVSPTLCDTRGCQGYCHHAPAVTR